MLVIEKITTAHEFYPFMEELIQAAFPKEERRDMEDLRKFTNHHPLFHNNILKEDDQPIGLLTYWDFNQFFYVEHFAIDSRLRSQGYGGKALNLLKEKLKSRIVLEVEEPTDEASRKRISFYQKQGFVLHDEPYMQPPYRSGDEWIKMKLMTFGTIDMKQEYTSIRNTLYREVYQYKTS